MSRNRDPFRAIGDLYDFIVRANFSFLQHAKIKSGPWCATKQGWHARLVHANADAVAGYARLRHFEERITNAVSVADADLVISKPFNGEVLSELAETEIIAAQEALPVVVGVHLINKDGALLPTVTGEIPLPVAINIELAHHPPLVHRKFPHRGSDSPTVPCHVPWNTDVH